MLHSLHVRVLVPLVAALALVTAAFTVAGVVIESRVIDAIVAERTHSLSTIVRHDIIRAMRAGRASELQWILNDLASNPDIASVRILAVDGVVRRSTRPSEVATVLPAHVGQANATGDLMVVAADARQREIIHRVEPLMNREECSSCHAHSASVIGLLDLDLDVSRQRAGARTWWTMNALLGAVQLIALTALAFPVLSVLVIRPIRRLAGSMAQVHAGHLEEHVPPVGTGELDALVNGFNAMVVRLREAATAEEQTRRLQFERAEQLAAVGELAAGLAHEIRSPLSAVKAAVEVLADDMPADEPRRAILLESATELARIGAVTRDLLEYAKPRPPSFATFDLNGLVAHVVSLNTPQATKQGTGLTVALARDPLPVEADEGMTRQVLVNLALNALQAVSGVPGGMVEITTARDGAVALCRVRDNGPGVAFAQAESIFKPFVTTKSRGTGLGLAISRRLLEIQAGRLWLENAGHHGASFVFSLPVARTEARRP